MIPGTQTVLTATALLLAVVHIQDVPNVTLNPCFDSKTELYPNG
jgi:hypothetical protein